MYASTLYSCKLRRFYTSLTRGFVFTALQDVVPDERWIGRCARALVIEETVGAAGVDVLRHARRVVTVTESIATPDAALVRHAFAIYQSVTCSCVRIHQRADQFP